MWSEHYGPKYRAESLESYWRKNASHSAYEVVVEAMGYQDDKVGMTQTKDHITDWLKTNNLHCNLNNNQRLKRCLNLNTELQSV